MHPVGSLPDGDSPYGVKDMSGNAREWVSDWYDPDYYKHAPDQNPQGPEKKGVVRSIRGGSWHSPMSDITTTASGRGGFALQTHGTGFRCAGALRVRSSRSRRSRWGVMETNDNSNSSEAGSLPVWVAPRLRTALPLRQTGLSLGRDLSPRWAADGAHKKVGAVLSRIIGGQHDDVNGVGHSNSGLELPGTGQAHKHRGRVASAVGLRPRVK